jgi:hypothetical protein
VATLDCRVTIGWWWVAPQPVNEAASAIMTNPWRRMCDLAIVRRGLTSTMELTAALIAGLL